MSILHKSYKKIYPILRKFESFLVTELKDDKVESAAGRKLSESQSKKLTNRLGDQEEMIIKRTEDITENESFNLENLLGFINQKKLNSYLNISNIMRLSKLDFPDLYFWKDLDLMLVRKTLLEKVTLV